MPNPQSSRDQLLQAGLRAAGRADCKSVLVAPDHTGEDNYHNCSRSSLAEHESHYCGCGYSWDSSGAITQQAVFAP